MRPLRSSTVPALAALAPLAAAWAPGACVVPTPGGGEIPYPVDALGRPVEGMVVPMDASGWKIGRELDDGSRRSRDWIRTDETMAAWTRMVSVGFQDARLAIPPPEEHMQALVDEMLARDPAVSVGIIERGEGSILYETEALVQGGVSEHTLARIVRGNEGTHRVAFIRRGKEISASERDSWIRALRAAYFVKGTQRIEGPDS